MTDCSPTQPIINKEQKNTRGRHWPLESTGTAVCRTCFRVQFHSDLPLEWRKTHIPGVRRAENVHSTSLATVAVAFGLIPIKYRLCRNGYIRKKRGQFLGKLGRNRYTSGPFSGRMVLEPMGWPYLDRLHCDSLCTGKSPKDDRVYPILTSPVFFSHIYPISRTRGRKCLSLSGDVPPAPTQSRWSTDARQRGERWGVRSVTCFRLFSQVIVFCIRRAFYVFGGRGM